MMIDRVPNVLTVIQTFCYPSTPSFHGHFACISLQCQCQTATGRVFSVLGMFHSAHALEKLSVDLNLAIHWLWPVARRGG